MKGARATGLLVSKRLGACGFKRSVVTSNNITSGFLVKNYGDSVTVKWNESQRNYERRLKQIPSQRITDLPPHEDTGRYLEAYADALSTRWEIELSPFSVFVRQRSYQEELVPSGFYRKIRRLIEESGAQFMGVASYAGSLRSGVAITQEPGHVRIMVRPWTGTPPWDSSVVGEANRIVLETIQGNGWEITSYECLEGLVIKVRNRS